MHNNFYFLRQLSNSLEKRIQGFTVVSCFSQNKDELIFEFNSGGASFFLKATLGAEFQCLSFPSGFSRARKNSIDLWEEIIMKKVTGARQFQNERSFALLLEGSLAVVFKMHGKQANVLLFQDQRAIKIFRNNFAADADLTLKDLDRTIDWSWESFQGNQDDLARTYVTLGKPVWVYLRAHGFEKKEAEQQWMLLRETVAKLETPSFYIAEQQGGLHLTLLPTDAPQHVLTDPIEAANEFFSMHMSQAGLQKDKVSLLSTLRGRIKQTHTFIEKTRQRLTTLDDDHHFQAWADLIMANMHHIQRGAESVTLPDFQDASQTVTVKLKKELSPQKNAEAYYRKSKNQNVERQTLEDTLARKESELDVLTRHEEEVRTATDRAALRPIGALYIKVAKEKDAQLARPYHEHEQSGYRIWVGKNAKANDELTLRHTFKDDLWLHAKDVAGSHVVIKHQAGKEFPKDVVERAAQLAAYHSKRKNESLCPVAFTPAKFVRKRKGDPAGVVVVEREKVLMVEPRK
ncbi:MAG: NFACT RNA binding domain-containing protein [Cytophagales bacterium]|nr:NFACT RNA binding domain-containing protein [Cytophagales bacterium]